MKEIIGQYTEGMKSADLHMHTNLSRDTRGGGLEPEEVVNFASEIGINLVAITDHHDISGAERAKEYAIRYEKAAEIVTGVEITTDEGHLLGLYVRESIERTNLEGAIYEIHRQGGLVIVPHPFLRSIGLSEKTLLRLTNDSSGELWIDGFEVFSQGAQDVFYARGGASQDSNKLALDFYIQHSDVLGAPISSSDSHGITIGRARTVYFGNLAKAIEEKTTVAMQLDPGEQGVLYDAAKAKFGTDRGRESKLRGRLRDYYDRNRMSS